MPLNGVARRAVAVVDGLEHDGPVLPDALAQRKVRHRKAIQSLDLRDCPRVGVGHLRRWHVVDVLIVRIQLCLRQILVVAPTDRHHGIVLRLEVLNGRLIGRRCLLGCNRPQLVLKDLSHDVVAEGLEDGGRHRHAVLGLVLPHEVNGRVLDRITRTVGLGDRRQKRLERRVVEDAIHVRHAGRHLERKESRKVRK